MLPGELAVRPRSAYQRKPLGVTGSVWLAGNARGNTGFPARATINATCVLRGPSCSATEQSSPDPATVVRRKGPIVLPGSPLAQKVKLHCTRTLRQSPTSADYRQTFALGRRLLAREKTAARQTRQPRSQQGTAKPRPSHPKWYWRQSRRDSPVLSNNSAHKLTRRLRSYEIWRSFEADAARPILTPAARAA